MGLSIRVPGVSFTNFIDELYPFPDNAKGIFFFGGTEEETLTNQVLNHTGMPSIVGSPVIGANFATVGDSTKGIKTGLVPKGAVTLVAVIKDLASPQIVGTYSSAGGLVSMKMGENSGNFRFGFTRESFNGAVAAPLTGWRFLAGTGSSSEHRVVAYDADQALSTEYARTVVNDNPDDYQLTAGGRNISGQVDTDIATVMYYDRALTPQEIEEVYVWLKSKMLARGITLS